MPSPRGRLSTLLLTLLAGACGDGRNAEFQLPPRVWREADVLTARSDHAMVWDSWRGMPLVFGGTHSPADTWYLTNSGWFRAAPVTAPQARYGAAMAFDPGRGVAVLFGGGVGVDASLEDTWEWDGGAWREREPAHKPPARTSARMAFDTKRGRPVLFGGYVASLVAPFRVFADMWEWDGTDWREIALPSGPPARFAHAMCAAPGGGLVLFGGGSAGTPYLLGDTWLWDGASWSQLAAPTAPPARAYHSLCLGPRGADCVLFGGYAPGPSDETWVLSGTLWSKSSLATSPSPRAGHDCVRDAARSELVLFGGYGERDYSDTWAYDASGRWKLARDEAHPSARRAHAMAAGQGIGLLFGGDTASAVSRQRASSALSDETWVSSGFDWVRLRPATVPPARRGHALAFDPRRARFVMFGGVGADGRKLGDTWEWMTDRQDWVLAATTGPTPRMGHALVFAAERGRTLLFGGLEDDQARDDTWEWDGVRWVELTPGARPPSRYGHAMAWDARSQAVVLFGGVVGTEAAADTWIWSGGGWRLHVQDAAPPARASHGLAGDGRDVLLFGGERGSTALDDCWSWNGTRWLRSDVFGSPGTRAGCTLVRAGGRVICFGGERDVALLEDTWFIIEYVAL